MSTHVSETMPEFDPPSVPACSRRDALRAAAGLGLFAAAGLLGACGSAGQRRLGLIGDPLPPDPVLHRSSPSAPVYTPPPPSPGPSGPVPNIVPRTNWTKGTPRTWLADPMGGIGRITVHHDGIHPQPNPAWASVVGRLESIRKGHLGRGWADIGYHYAVDPKGRVWACRPIDLQGAHVKDQNQHNLGIVLLGNFDRSTPTPAAQRALSELLTYEMRRLRVSLRDVRTHQELAPTACPGRSLQSYMDHVRSRTGVLARV